ncbi:Uncharacterized membrane protein YcaP, DUF421 family [Caminicella sporogenes DSM 14501]|uniref:Uncharacterized membrane protein YcaP, DUF421 family n=1 Tax=Caminicella sporogenes DSM 14501 TaxID=1121266 RepID=A0A1M6R847_9FIRM|nr:DUF421 domain-containing protein [Caminicella sporogenes]RKD27337.1 hypothetical protein BET04_09385 [Caminicella sporogenes]SHK28644.1 Uncharacterized membrane protein YcaP, DUF421 family [Caminicella sporogenes DSM 14501]
MDLIHTSIELILGFIALLIVTKLIGNRQISQITPFDFISAIVLGELLGNAIYDREISIFHILYALFLWGMLMLTVEMLTQKYLKVRGFLEGNPSIVIRKGVIDRDELKKNRLDINELQNLLRQKDVFSIREVEYAILESDGKISVLKKSKYMVPTNEDLKLSEKPVYLPVTFIIDGEVLWDNVKACGFEEEWLIKQLKRHGIDKPEDVFYAEWKEDEGMYVLPFEHK